MKQVRKLKIQGKFRSRTFDYINIPAIRLEGKWLKELGFHEGKQISIYQERKRLIITLDEEK